jgi:hypothetical protein
VMFSSGLKDLKATGLLATSIMRFVSQRGIGAILLCAKGLEQITVPGNIQ